MDTSMGAVADAVHAVEYRTLTNQKPEEQIKRTIQRRVRKFGFEVEAVTFTDIGKVRTLRLIQAGQDAHHLVHGMV
jgi:hypothetical protein